MPERIWNAFVGCSIPNARAMINDLFGDEGLTDRLFAHQRDLFFALEDEILVPREGALEALSALADAGMTLALATTTAREHALKEMERFGMAPFFSTMTFGAPSPRRTSTLRPRVVWAWRPRCVPRWRIR